MVKLFKNKVDFTGVAVLLMAFFVAVGFKAAESMQAPKWYQVTLDDPAFPNDSSNQKINASTPSGWTPTSPCTSSTATYACGIQLTIGAGEDIPETVEEAEEMHDDNDVELTIGSRAFRPNL